MGFCRSLRIFAAHVAAPKANPDEIAFETMTHVLGGSFNSRINMNLREDKHWSYGAGTLVFDAAGPRPFMAYAPVQTDKTRESMEEVAKEMRGIVGPVPVTEDELDRAKRAQTLRLPGAWETAGRVAGSISEIVRFGLPDDYFQTYPENVRALRSPRTEVMQAQGMYLQLATDMGQCRSTYTVFQ